MLGDHNCSRKHEKEQAKRAREEEDDYEQA